MIGDVEKGIANIQEGQRKIPFSEWGLFTTREEYEEHLRIINFRPESEGIEMSWPEVAAHIARWEAEAD